MASRSVNKVILLGNLGKDAETKFTQSQIARTTFSVATTRRLKDSQTNEWKDETEWHNVVLWRSENVANYLLKGTRVYIEGRMQTRSWDDKDGNKKYMTEVVADELILLGGRGEGGGGGPDMGAGRDRDRDNMVSMPRSAMPSRSPAPSNPEPPSYPEVVSDDDVPF
jgi:single-strand DNA-binding protein